MNSRVCSNSEQKWLFKSNGIFRMELRQLPNIFLSGILWIKSLQHREKRLMIQHLREALSILCAQFLRMVMCVQGQLKFCSRRRDIYKNISQIFLLTNFFVLHNISQNCGLPWEGSFHSQKSSILFN